MKKQMIPGLAGWIATIALAFFTLQCESNVAANDDFAPRMSMNDPATSAQMCECLLLQYPSDPLSEAEADALRFMREEEKLARDVYNHFNETWTDRTFANIARSEQRHMDAVACLLRKYELTDPAADKGPGEFTNPDLQALYDQLTTEGAESLEAALRVGARIEDLDIYDLQRQLEVVDNADIQAVFENLTRGSRNHLRAYTSRLSALGVTYVPAYLGETEYAAILEAPHERGNGPCGACANGNASGPGNCQGNRNGQGPGNGPGNCQGNGPGNCQGNGPGQGGGQGNRPRN